MLPVAYMNIRRSPSGEMLGYHNWLTPMQVDTPVSQRRVSCVVMGPVVASLAMYATERVLKRVIAGQLLRKGVARKTRRLMVMIMEPAVLVDVLIDCLEELVDWLSCCC